MEDQTSQLRNLVFLELRAKLVEELVKHGAITHHENTAGWWVDDKFISLYDVMEAIRDQR